MTYLRSFGDRVCFISRSIEGYCDDNDDLIEEIGATKVQPSPSIHLPDFLKVLAHELRWKILTFLTYSDRTVAEIVHFLAEPQNVVSYHLRKLRELHVVTERRSSADSRDVYYSLDF